MFLTGMMKSFYLAVLENEPYKPLSLNPHSGAGGEKPKSSSNKAHPWNPVTINRLAPFPQSPLVGFGKGGGIGRIPPLFPPPFGFYAYIINVQLDCALIVSIIE